MAGQHPDGLFAIAAEPIENRASNGFVSRAS
jgi:hypothetical protein